MNIINKIVNLIPIVLLIFGIYSVLAIGYMINSKIECTALGATRSVHTFTFRTYCEINGKYELLK